MAQESAEAQRANMLSTARALAAAVDAKIDKHITLGRTLVTLPSLLDDDLRVFEADARRALADVKDTWVVVADLEGQQLVNTFAPVGARLPKRTAAAIAAQQAASERNDIVISDASFGPITGRLYSSIHFPIRKDGRPFRDLGIPMMADGFLAILKAQSIPEGWRASITDSQGVMIARLPYPERYVGRIVADPHRPYLGQTGVFEWTSIDGETLVAAGAATANGWTTTVGVTRTALFAGVWHDVRWISLAAAAVILASIAVAYRIGGGIVRPIQALAAVDSLETDQESKRWIASLPESAAVAQHLVHAKELLVRTRNQLVRSEARLRLALEAGEAGTWEANFAKGTLVASDNALTMHGFAPGSVITPEQGLAAFLPEDRPLVQSLAVDAYKTGNPFTVEVRVGRPDGSIRWIASRGAVRDGPDGRYLVGLVQDITERRKAEDILREHDARLETVFENLPIGVGMFDLTGKVILANRQMLKRLPNGLVPSHDAEAQRRRWRLHPRDPTPIPPAYFPGARALRGERVVPGMELIYVDDDGRETWLNVASAPIRDAQGTIYAAFGAVTDITERKRYEQTLSDLNRELETRVDERTRQLQREMKLREDAQAQLAQSQRLDALGKLTGGIAHDFNNLLTVILGNLELAELQAAQDELKILVQQAMAAAEAGASINRRLLSFARHQALSPQRLNLNDRVREMHELLQRSMGEKITLVPCIEPNLGPTVADPGEIDSAIVNIAINARDAMPDGGTLTITTRNVTVDEAKARQADVAPGDYVCISISDTGDGMAPEILKRAMEPFFTTKEAGRGSGLGLSSVYGFLRQSGGFMDIDSKVGHGTIVGMYLPRAPETRPELARPCGEGDHRGNGELILVVEDNDRVREIAGMNLRSLGYQVIEAPNAIKAKTVLASTDGIKLVFSDVMMPGGMNGYDLAQWIRTEKPGMKVLLASGHNDLALDKGLQSSVRLLGKPYKRLQFAQAIKELLG